VTAFTILTTWQRGREIVLRKRERAEGPLRGFIDELHARKHPVVRVPGTAVFLNRNPETAPLAMRAIVDHLHTLSEHVVILTIDTLTVPHVAPDERLVIDDLGYTDDAITHASARFGYMDRADVPEVLRLLEHADIECPLEVDEASYFLSTVELVLSDDPDMSQWRKHLFLATSHIAADAAEYFGLPRDRTVILGSRIEV
jgi:KUP system potassium uptake protein